MTRLKASTDYLSGSLKGVSLPLTCHNWGNNYLFLAAWQKLTAQRTHDDESDMDSLELFYLSE